MGREDRAILGWAVAIVIAVGLFVGLDAYNRRDQVLQQARRNNEAAARAAAEYSRAAFEGIALRMEDAVRAHAIWRAEASPSPESGYRLLSEIVRGTKQLTGIGWMNESGDLVASSVAANRRRINVADEPHFIAQQKDRGSGLFLSPPIASRQDGRKIITLSRRLETADGRFKGIVTGFSDLQELQLGLARMRLNDSTGIRLLLPNELPLVEVVPVGGGPFLSNRERIDGLIPLLVEAVGDEGEGLENWWQYIRRSVGLWLLFTAVIAFGTSRLIKDNIQRKRAEASQTLLNARLAAIVENSNDAIISRDMAGRILTWNAGAQIMLGYTAEEVIGKLTSYLIPQDNQSVRLRNNERLLMGEVASLETMLAAKDGRVIPVLSNFSPIRDGQGTVVGVSIIMQDISERLGAQRALKESEERFRSMAEMSSDFYWETDREHRLIRTALNETDASKRTVFMHGLGTGATRWEVPYLSPDEEGWAAHRADLAARLAFRKFELSRLGSDGAPHYLSISGDPVFDSAGTFTGYRGVGTDITEEKKLMSMVEGHKRHMEALIETTPVGVFETDSLGKFVFVNKRWTEIAGLSSDLALGDGWQEALYPGDRERIYTEWTRSAMDSRPFSMEYRFLHPDGKVVWVFGQSKEWLSVSGERLGFIGSVTDITERKRAEAARSDLEVQLRESQKMQAIGTLAGGIAHDFNNALAAILGNAELARVDADSNPALLESLEEIRKAGTRARDLVQQILAFSRRQPSEKLRTELTPIVHEAARLLRASIPVRISLDVQCASDVKPVLGNATQLEQVLINLGTNAMHAMPSGPGRIDIRLDTVMLDSALARTDPALWPHYEQHPGMTVRVSVTDTGIGMDTAMMERIFEPFFTTKPAGEGTGLGLSVVHGIVKSHDGVITVQSAPGKGTTFTIYLPVAQVLAEENPKPRHAATPAVGMDGGHRILYLDDEPALLSLVKRLLERRGYQVSTYGDPKVALGELRTNATVYDLVVTDYNMPGMSGLEVAREARTIRADLPVAVASGFIDEILREQADEAGVREVIFKADEVHVFCAAVQRLVEGAGKASQPASAT